MSQMLLYLYSFFYVLGAGLYFAFASIRFLRTEKRTAALERLGLPRTLHLLKSDPDRTTVWIHAVSVGEVNAVRPLVEALARRDNTSVFLSTVTPTGQQVARESLARYATLFYFPLDLRFICRRYFRQIRPDAVLVVETELWPNFLTVARQETTPVILVNGRISDRSFRRYRRFRFFFAPLLRSVSHYCMQSKQSRERILEMGAAPEKVNWVGNLKFDYSLETPPAVHFLVERLERILKPTPASRIWICGSTKPGEEELLLPVFRNLREDHPELRLLLAPRHPHRAREVHALVERQGLRAQLRSALSDGDPAEPPDVLVLDTVGELAHLYRLGDLVFMGGSLVPTGGQNVIEPAYFGKPILVGPDMRNFPEIAEVFKEAYAMLQVASPEELEARIRDLLADPHAAEWLSRNARKVMRNNQGALERTLEVVERFLS